MSSGLYQDHFVVERFTASAAAATIAQRYVAPVDLDVLGGLPPSRKETAQAI